MSLKFVIAYLFILIWYFGLDLVFFSTIDIYWKKTPKRSSYYFDFIGKKKKRAIIIIFLFEFIVILAIIITFLTLFINRGYMLKSIDKMLIYISLGYFVIMTALNVIKSVRMKSGEGKKEFILDFKKIDQSKDVPNLTYYGDYEIDYQENNFTRIKSTYTYLMIFDHIKWPIHLFSKKSFIRRKTYQIINSVYYVDELKKIPEEERIYKLLSSLYVTLKEFNFIKDIYEWENIMKGNRN